MKKISEAVRELVLANTCLHFGLYHGLMNLTQLARFLQPLVETRTHKSATPSAIAMSLSRLQRKLPEGPPEGSAFYIDRINVHRGLGALTLGKTPRAHREVQQLFAELQQRGGYLTVTEGVSEITAILESRYWGLIETVLTQAPRHVEQHLAALGVTFKEPYTDRPGLLYQLLQQLALQNLNVVEVASTRTEFSIYLHEHDLMPAFDAVYQRFSGTERQPER